MEQLYRLKDRFLPDGVHTEWATFDDPQSRSMLEREKVHYVRYVSPRGYGAMLSNVPKVENILRQGHFDQVVTTGAGIALSFLPVARAHGLRCHYIESAARADGPSLTGSIIARLPGVHLYSQYPSWAGGRWNYRGSLFDCYEARPTTPAAPARRVVITLGTMRTYGYRRAVDALLSVLPDVTSGDAEILWQVGATDVSDLSIDAHRSVPSAQMMAAISEADLVIAHAGTGSALSALDMGKCPVLLPRRRAYGEHVDDHQLMIARELDRRGLSVSRDPEALTADDLLKAMSMTVRTANHLSPFALTR